MEIDTSIAMTSPSSSNVRNKDTMSKHNNGDITPTRDEKRNNRDRDNYRDLDRNITIETPKQTIKRNNSNQNNNNTRDDEAPIEPKSILKKETSFSQNQRHNITTTSKSSNLNERSKSPGMTRFENSDERNNNNNNRSFSPPRSPVNNNNTSNNNIEGVAIDNNNRNRRRGSELMDPNARKLRMNKNELQIKENDDKNNNIPTKTLKQIDEESYTKPVRRSSFQQHVQQQINKPTQPKFEDIHYINNDIKIGQGKGSENSRLRNPTIDDL